ncbi:hypothetical protein [Paenibacillus lentus]|uniref:Lipoprotein n=1 Tax=Paenibacillus lentus TaxID=1338368 RepID=A0A3S8S0F4_9BACL|nr:hypothetical protein [Paenibacillus lentus]AZK48625.1 hypothetical protein EIM92_22605 [Paenibacillus lentus]
MKPWTKRFILVFLSLIMLWGVSGCMNKKPKAEVIKDLMMAHLEEKYGEEFLPMSLSFSNLAYSYDTLLAYPKNGSKQDYFEVEGTRMEDGSYSIRDGYFGVFIKPKYEAVMSGFVHEIYDEFKLYTNFGEGALPDRLNKDTPFEEIYNKDEHFSSDTVVFVKQTSAENIDIELSLLQIAGKMRQKQMVGYVRIFVIFDEKFDLIGQEVLNISASKDKEYFVDNPKSVMVTPDLKVRQNGMEVNTNGRIK